MVAHRKRKQWELKEFEPTTSGPTLKRVSNRIVAAEAGHQPIQGSNHKELLYTALYLDS